MHNAHLETLCVSVSAATTRCCSRGYHHQMSLAEGYHPIQWCVWYTNVRVYSHRASTSALSLAVQYGELDFNLSPSKHERCFIHSACFIWADILHLNQLYLSTVNNALISCFEGGFMKKDYRLKTSTVNLSLRNLRKKLVWRRQLVDLAAGRPFSVRFSLLSCSLGQKFGQIIVWHPPLWGGNPENPAVCVNSKL